MWHSRLVDKKDEPVVGITKVGHAMSIEILLLLLNLMPWAQLVFDQSLRKIME